MNTPWGKADNIIKIHRGLTWVGTPSHGGFMVADGFARKHLSAAALLRGERFGNYYAFEEDCDYAIVMLELFELLTSKSVVDFPLNIPTREKLLEALSTWHADYLLARGITPVEPQYSWFKKNRDEDALRAAKGPLVVAAWGSWAPGVPKDHVRVELADGRRFIIRSLEYQSLPTTEIPTIDKFPSAVEVPS